MEFYFSWDISSLSTYINKPNRRRSPPNIQQKKKQQKEQERCANTHTHRYSLLILAKVERSQFNRRHEHVSDGRPGRTKKKNRIWRKQTSSCQIKWKRSNILYQLRRSEILAPTNQRQCDCLCTMKLEYYVLQMVQWLGMALGNKRCPKEANQHRIKAEWQRWTNMWHHFANITKIFRTRTNITNNG